MTSPIRTKTDPPIFYFPGNHTKDTEHLLEVTRGMVWGKIASLKDQLKASSTPKGGASS